MSFSLKKLHFFFGPRNEFRAKGLDELKLVHS
jgi:hypothetical protein